MAIYIQNYCQENMKFIFSFNSLNKDVLLDILYTVFKINMLILDTRFL